MVRLDCGNLVNQKSLENSKNKGIFESGLEKMTSKTEDLSKYSELMKLLNDDDDLSKAGMNKCSENKEDQATGGNTADVEMKKKIHSDFIATLKNSRNAVLAKFFLTKSCVEPRQQVAQTGRRRAATSGQKTAPAPKKMKYGHVINKPLPVESSGDVSSSTRAGTEQADPNSFSPPTKLAGNQRMTFTNQIPQVIDRPGSSCEFQKSIDMARCGRSNQPGSREVQTYSNLSDFLANNHLIGQSAVPVSLQNFGNSGIPETPAVPYINLSLMSADRVHGWNRDQSLGFQNDRKGMLMCSAEPGLIWREVNNSELITNAGNLPSDYLVDDQGKNLALLGAKSSQNGKHNLTNIPQVVSVVPEVKFGKRMSSDCREMPSCGKENNASDFINAFDCVDQYERTSYGTVGDCQLDGNLGALKQEGPDEYALDLRTKVRSYRSVQEFDSKWMAVDKTIVTSLVDAIMGDSDVLIESLMNEPRSNCFSEEVQWNNCYRSTTQLHRPTYPTKFNEFHHRSPTTPNLGRRGGRSYADNDDVNNVGNYVSMLNDVASHESDDVSSMCDEYGWGDGYSMKWKTNILSRAKDEVC